MSSFDSGISGFLSGLKTWGDSSKSDSQKYGSTLSDLFGSVGSSFGGSSGSGNKSSEDMSWAFQPSQQSRQSFSGQDPVNDPMRTLASQRQYPEDTLVAHISPYEAALLKLMGGAGTRNKNTGLLQFGDPDGGDGDGGGDEGGGDDGGGFNGGDRGFDAGSLGGEDRGGTGGDLDGSDYAGHGFSDGGGRDGGYSRDSDSFSPHPSMQQGPIGQRFQDAFAPSQRIRSEAPSFADTLSDMDQSQRADYMSNVADLNNSPFGDYGISRATNMSRAGDMFGQAKARQIADAVNIGDAIDQGLSMYGYNNNPVGYTQPDALAGFVDDGTYSRYFDTDWGRFNLTSKLGNPQNAMDSSEFSSYVSNSPVAAALLGNIRDMELNGQDVTGMGITSGNKGKHAYGSRHYSDQAVDTNTKIGSGLLSGLTSRMEAQGFNRGDKLGFGARESMHFQ